MIGDLRILDAVTVGDLIILISGIIAIAGFFRWKIYPIFKRTDQFLGDWFGEEARPGVKRRPGVVEQLANLHERLDTVEENKHKAHADLRAGQEALELKVAELNSKFESHVTLTEETRRAGHLEAQEMWRAVLAINSPEQLDKLLEKYARPKNGNSADSSTDK